MKKFFATLLIVLLSVLTIVLVGCGETEEPGSGHAGTCYDETGIESTMENLIYFEFYTDAQTLVCSNVYAVGSVQTGFFVETENQGFLFKGWALENGVKITDESGTLLPGYEVIDPSVYGIVDNQTILKLFAVYELPEHLVTVRVAGHEKTVRVKHGEKLSPIAIDGFTVSEYALEGKADAFDEPITSDLKLCALSYTYQNSGIVYSTANDNGYNKNSSGSYVSYLF